MVARYSDASVQAVSGTAQADTASLSDAEYAIPSLEGRRVAHESGTLHWEGKLPSGADGTARRGSGDLRSSVITKRLRRFERSHEGILALQRGEDVNSLLRNIEKRVANPIFRVSLRSCFHWIVSDRFALISYIGRRSGQRYTFPGAYHRLNGAIVVVTPKGETNWWRNFQEARECFVWLRGKEYTAMVKLVSDEEREPLLVAYVRTHGLLGRILGVNATFEAPSRPVESINGLAVVRFIIDPTG